MKKLLFLFFLSTFFLPSIWATDDIFKSMGQPWEARYHFFENWEQTIDPVDDYGNIWYSPSFNDTSWSTLVGPLDNNNWGIDFSGYYLRKVFTMPEGNKSTCFITVHHDDYVKVYLNGELVGEEDYTGDSSNFSIPRGLLVDGENLLAIYIDDRGGGGRLLDYEFHHIFTAQTVEGVDMTFKVISESEKTCMVGMEEYGVASITETYNGGITIPSEVNGYTVKRIGKWALCGRGGLTSVSIPETVESIGTQAFNFTGLTAITLPSNLKTIEDGVFQGCTGITSITIPASVTSIAGGTFDAATNLASIEVESGNQVYDSRNGCNAIIETATNSLIQGCKNTVIPNSVTNIADGAFIVCTGLSSIEIPASVKSIGHRAFFGCSNLTSVSLSKNLKTIDGDAFGGCEGLTSIVIPASVTGIGDYILAGCRGLTSIVVEDGNTVYDSRDNCNAIIETSTNTLVAGCKNTIIPNTVTCIGVGAFNDITNLTSIEIPSSVTTLKWWAFHNCGLTSINIPASVTSIEAGAFEACGNLTYVTVNNSVPIDLSAGGVHGNHVFSNCANATLIVPTGSRDAYANAEYWRDFSEILEPDDMVLPWGAEQAWTMKYVYGESQWNLQEPALDSSDNPWYSEEYDDSEWETLTGPMARDNNRFAQVNHIWETEGSYYYLRRTFQMDDVKEGYYKIHGICDNNMTVYLNGQELEKTDLGGFSYSFFFPSSMLHSGENTLALFVFDWAGGDVGGDAYLDYRMCFDCSPITIAGTIVEIEATELKVTGEINGTDIHYLRKLINEHSLTSLDLSEARIVEGGMPYTADGETHTTENDVFGDGMFRGCPNLTSIILPSTITTIGTMALRGTGITSLTIPASVTSLKEGAYDVVGEGDGGIVEECASLTEIIVEEGNPYYYSVDNVVFTEREDVAGEGGKALVMFPPGIGGSYEVPNDVTFICPRAFVSCGQLTDITLSEALTSIGHTAFWGCYSLTTLTIPEGVTSIGHRAFCGCSLSSVTVKNRIPAFLGWNLFDGCENATLYVPFGSKQAYETAAGWQDFKEIVTFDENDQLGNTLSITVPTPLLTGKDAFISVNLTNKDEIIMTEFYLQLPEGISIANDEDGYPDVTINSGRNNRHSLEVVLNSEGLYHFVCFSSKNNAFKGHDGELFHINIICDENMVPGTYQASIKNILFSDIARNEITQSDYTFSITVMDVEMGDANGDGRINGMDVVETVDYIMERPSEYFVFAAADLTGDGEVNGMDLVELVSLVMAQNAQYATSMRLAPAITCPTDLRAYFSALTSTEVQLGISSHDGFILTQFVIDLSDSNQLIDVTTDSSHAASWKELGNGRYAILLYSSRNSSFKSNDAIACLHLSGNCQLTAKNIMVVDTDREEHWLANVSSEGLTGINQLMEDELQDAVVYDMQGRKQTERTQKGLFIVNGKKIIMK